MKNIIKRDGSVVPFSLEKITTAINKAFTATGEVNVEKSLMQLGYNETAKAYIIYRAERERQRDKNSRLMKTLDQIARSDAKENDLKRENANIDGNTAMGTMLKYGSESAKTYYRTYMLPDKIREAHENGDIHIHDLDFYNLTMTCCQIDLTRLFKDGFSTGHGFLREPNSIESYGALAAIAMKANQNDMHGGQSVPNFDRDMAPGVAKTFAKKYTSRLIDSLEDYFCISDQEDFINQILGDIESAYGINPTLDNSDKYDTFVAEKIMKYSCIFKEEALKITERARKRALRETEKATHQAMEIRYYSIRLAHTKGIRRNPRITLAGTSYQTDAFSRKNQINNRPR